MMYGRYEVVNPPQPQGPPQPQIQPRMQLDVRPYMQPLMPPQMQVYSQPPNVTQPDRAQHVTQPDQAQPAIPQNTNDVLEVAGNVLDLAEQVLELQDRRSPTWASLERGGTPTSPYTSDEVGI